MTKIRKFTELPLGTRFKYKEDHKTQWVILESHGYGLIAKWDGVDGPIIGQSICSATNDEDELSELEVIVVE